MTSTYGAATLPSREADGQRYFESWERFIKEGAGDVVKRYNVGKL
jgi:hypothetical protein